MPEDTPATIPDLVGEFRELYIQLEKIPASPIKSLLLNKCLKIRKSLKNLSSPSEQNEHLVAALREARTQLESLRAEVDKLTTPPSSYAVFSTLHEDGTATVFVSGRKMRVQVHASFNLEDLKRGRQVLLNDALNIVQVADFEIQGEVVRIKEILDEGRRVLVSARMEDERVAEVAESLKGKKLSVGDDLLYDPRSGYVVEKLPKSEAEELVLEEVPDISYEQIGGLRNEVEEVRDAVELPFLHPELFTAYQLEAPKGVLLYGPPGCGKTLIARAVANAVAKKLGALSGKEVRSFFLHVKGPELLNKYVGESERNIREVFAKAKEKASSNNPVIIFFDEMDALFRTRGSGVSSDMEATIVPQFLSELDGVERLRNVIVIGASNRQDLIDPAILRAGRMDVRVKIGRPDNPCDGFHIALKYFLPNLPLPDRYVGNLGKPYVTINRLHSLVPEIWQKLHDELAPIRKEFSIQWRDLPKRMTGEEELAIIRERIIKNTASDIQKEREYLEVLQQYERTEWCYEEWRFQNVHDVVFYELYRMIEGMYIRVPQRNDAIDRGDPKKTASPLRWVSRGGNLVVFDSRFLDVVYKNGSREYLYHRDFLSGAIIEGIIRRAKKFAIKAEIVDARARGIAVEHLYRAIREEFSNQEDLPKSTTPDDWAKIMGKGNQEIQHIERIDNSVYASGKTIETITAGHYF